MNSLIFKVVARYLAWFLHLVAIWLLFRGHNSPGGGFIAGLISGAAFVIQALAYGLAKIPKLILHRSLPLAGMGLLMSVLAGSLSLLLDKPFLTGVWVDIPLGFFNWHVGSPVLFDLGVFVVVLSVVSMSVLALLKQEDLSP